jgi:hypothetical protein
MTMGKPTLTAMGIRQDIVTRLQGKTAAGDKVFDSRTIKYEKEELPAITVTTLGGTDDKWSIGTLLVKHTERIAIVGDVTGTDEAEVAAALDSLEGEILDALAGDPEWIGAFDSVEKMDSAKKLDDTTADLLGHVAVVVEMHYPVKYVPATEPEPLVSLWVDTKSTEPVGANVSDRPLLDNSEGG